MTDISVIKMIISVAVWRIYPSWVNDKLRAWEGLGHSGMFWARLSRDDFRSKLENISLPSRVMFISKSFSVSLAFVRFGAKRSSSEAFGFDDALELFLKTSLRLRAFLRTLNMTTRSRFFWKFRLFFKAEPVSLAWQHWWSPGWANHFRDGTSKTRMKTRLPDVDEIERRRIVNHRRDRYESLAVIHGPKEKKKTQWSQSVIARSINPSSFTKPASFRSLFRIPDVTTVLHFTVFLYVDAQLQVGQAAARGRAKRSSHPWHFRCWSPKRNELECNRSGSTGQRQNTVFRHVMQLSLLILCLIKIEKHFDGDFTPDQEKEITFKRWPPGYQTWKLTLALNGLMTT